MTEPLPIAVVDVRKRFGETTAVDGLGFEVAPGESFGLLGPNGAGKTTTLSMIATLLRPDAGKVFVSGLDVTREPESVRRLLGLVPQDLSVYVDLTARENLAFFGKLYGLRGAALVICNDYELELIREKTGLGETEILERAGTLVVTRGEHGSSLYRGASRVDVPAVTPKVIADPTGVGDAYRGGLMKGLAHSADLETCGRLARKDGLDAVFEKHRLDALVAPTGAPAWVIDPVSGDHFVGGSSTPAAVAGYPSISLPMGFVFGLPVGLSFIGPAWSEATLVKLAFAFEQATHHRRPPRFLTTAELPRG